MTMMQGTLEGAGGIELAFRSWRRDAAPRALVVIAHGFKAHGGMYSWVAEQLVAQGFAVHCSDLRGHGKSAGERYHADKFDDYVVDLAKSVAYARAHAGSTPVPVFVLGHSAGGVIACTYALEHPGALAGLICEDFAYALPPPEVALALLKGVAHLAPHAHLLDLKDEDFSRDPTFVAAMKADPLALHTPGTVQLLAELIRADERLKVSFAQITLPLLILHGTGDRIAKVQGSQALHAAAGSTDKTLTLYDGHFHDLLNDLGKERVMADVLAWLSARMGGAS